MGTQRPNRRSSIYFGNDTCGTAGSRSVSSRTALLTAAIGREKPRPRSPARCGSWKASGRPVTSAGRAVSPRWLSGCTSIWMYRASGWFFRRKWRRALWMITGQKAATGSACFSANIAWTGWRLSIWMPPTLLYFVVVFVEHCSQDSPDTFPRFEDRGAARPRHTERSGPGRCAIGCAAGGRAADP